MQSWPDDLTRNKYISHWQWQTVANTTRLGKFCAFDFIFCIFICSRILCDTGESNKPDYIKHLKTVLNDEKATISDIILTHWHHDHIGGVKDVLQCLDDASGEAFIL